MYSAIRIAIRAAVIWVAARIDGDFAGIETRNGEIARSIYRAADRLAARIVYVLMRVVPPCAYSTTVPLSKFAK